jgi:hypothetical protein
LGKDTLETALAMCDSHVSILDEFPPHEWHGPTACADWWKAYNAYNEKNGVTDGDAPLGTPWTVDITGDRAYFVAPMTYTYKRQGKPVKEIRRFCRSVEANTSWLAHYGVGLLPAVNSEWRTRCRISACRDISTFSFF